MSLQLLLIGGGHAHLGVLDLLARRHRTGIDVTLVSAHSAQVYSGMLPGHLAGHYRLDECSIPLDPGKAPESLYQALVLLRQRPPAELRQADLASLWAWARQNWSLSRMRGIASVAA